MKRIEYIDRLKGFAILLVVMGHIYHFGLCHKQSMVNMFINSFHMPLFMFLSGFVIHTPPNMKKCITKFRRFLFPFFSVGFISALTVGKSISDFLKEPTYFGYWYLLILSIFYLFLFLAHFNSENRNLTGALYDLIVFICVYEAICLTLPFSGNTGQLLIYYWPFFWGGFFVRKFGIINYLCQYNWTYTICILSYCLYFYFIYVKNFQIVILQHHTQQIAATFAVFAIVYLFYHTKKWNSISDKALQAMGKYTLEIYCFHYFVLRLIHLTDFGSYCQRTNNSVIEAVVVILLSLIVIFVCIIVGKIISKSSIFRYIVLGK